MSNSTQNDWAKEILFYLENLIIDIGTQVTDDYKDKNGLYEGMSIKNVKTRDAYKKVFVKLLADARKEVVTEVEKMLWSIHKDEINGANIRWNESLGLAISRLATLGEEEDVEGQMKHWGYGEGIEQTAVKAKGSALTLDKLNES